MDGNCALLLYSQTLTIVIRYPLPFCLVSETRLSRASFSLHFHSFLFISLSVCLSYCLSVLLSVCLSYCLSVCLSVCLTVERAGLSPRTGEYQSYRFILYGMKHLWCMLCLQDIIMPVCSTARNAGVVTHMVNMAR